MDSEGKIIQTIKPLLKEYQSLTRGELPKDWVNIKEERQKEITRTDRQRKELEQQIKKVIEYNKRAKEKVIPALLEVSEVEKCEQIEEQVRENEELIQSYQNQYNDAMVASEQAKYELEQVQAQIERRRQKRIVLLKKKIYEQAKLYIDTDTEKEEIDNLLEKVEVCIATDREQIEQELQKKRYELEEMRTDYQKMKEKEKKVYSFRKQLKQQEQEEENDAYKIAYTIADTRVRNQVTELVKKRQEMAQIKQEIQQSEAKLEQLTQYSSASDEKIQNWTTMLEVQEKKDYQDSKIAQIKQELHQKAQMCEDLLPEDYEQLEENYIKTLEKLNIEELEAIKSVSISTLYRPQFEKALQQKDREKAKSIFVTMKKIEIRQNEMKSKGLKEKENIILKKEEAQEQEESIALVVVEKENSFIKKVMTNVASFFRNIKTNGINGLFGMELIGNEDVVMSEEQIQEQWKQNREKLQKMQGQVKKGRTEEKTGEKQQHKRVQELSKQELQDRVVRTRAEEIEKQLQEARERNDTYDVDYLERMQQKASEVVVSVNKENMRRMERYRRIHHIDKEAVEAEQRNQLQHEMQFQQGEYAIPKYLKKANMQEKPKLSFLQGLRVGISSMKQRRIAEKFLKQADKNKNEYTPNEISFGGE